MLNPNETEGALAGIVVLDLTRILAGPWCTQILADFGAEVLKIERPEIGDDTRSWGPPWRDLGEQPTSERREATYFASTNRNKKSVAIDISTVEGQETVRRLAATADVMVENFKVGDLARYKLDYNALRAINPGIIYCSITGYGQTGPFADRPGYDLIFQGEAGIMSVTGEREGLPGGGPQKVGVAVSDLVTGLYACNAVLAALQHRNRTGQGQAIDVALFDCTLAVGANLAFNHVAKGIQPQRYGNAHPTIVPYQVFATADGHIIVAVGNDTQWQRFCIAIERPDLAAAAQYLHGPGRIDHRESLVADLAQTLLTGTSAHWLERLEEFDVPHGGINGYAEAFAHPQALHRGMRVDLPANLGTATEAGVANPIKFSASPVQYRRAAPALGADTDDVLKRLLP